MQRPCSRRCMILHLLPSASSSQRSIIPFACFRRMLAAWAASASCSSSMHVPTDGWFSLSSVWKPLFHASVKLLVRSALFTVMSWTFQMLGVVFRFRSHYATDRLKSQIEIVDQRLCKRRHYSTHKVLCRIKSTSQSFVFSVKTYKRHRIFRCDKKLCNLTENQWFWSIVGSALPLSDSWYSFLVSRR